MFSLNRLFVAVFFTGFFLCFNNFSFAGNKMIYQKINDVPPGVWNQLAQKYIYFGHQSVGLNIIEGLQGLMSQYPQVKLNILETVDGIKEGGVFSHSRVGHNMNPESKITDFVDIVKKGGVSHPDIASLKFCYVDANQKVDIANLFKQYRNDMRDLKSRYPDLILIHFTMPLRAQEFTWKTRLKLTLGMDAWEFEDAVKRNQYNSMMLKEYQDVEPVFDIARFEATAPDGSISKVKYKGSDIIFLQDQYTDDGGHLNKQGREMIAEKFLLFMVNLL